MGKEELIEMQENNPTLEKFKTKSEMNTSKGGEVSFEVQDGVLYRVYKCASSGNGTLNASRTRDEHCT